MTYSRQNSRKSKFATEPNFVLHVTSFTNRAKKACQLVGGQELRELSCAWRFFQSEFLPGLLADVAELVVTQSLAAGEANKLGNNRRFRFCS